MTAKAKPIERQGAVVDGIDISGHWSRMFEQRVLLDYDLTTLDRIRDLPGAETFARCYQCAKCTSVCPAGQVADFSPRKLYKRVQTGLNLFEDDMLWLCTTCANCLRVCPKSVNMIEIMPAMREQAILEGNAPSELQKALENTFRYGNPLGEAPRKRADWTKDAGVPVRIMKDHNQPVDVLWFVECYPSYHPRGKDASRALARILTALGVDFGILGHEEKCAGDSQRLAGEKGLFETLVEHNVATLARYDFKSLLVTDPHALNAFRKEYPKYGGAYDVIHYSQFLAPRMRELTFKKKLDYLVTFHDPCYLGRHNGEYEAPRKVLGAIPGLRLTEMAHCKANSLCCGGGGGGMWMDGFVAEQSEERLSERRVREAVEVGADVLAVACPYEASRFEDAIKSTGNDGKLVVRDIAELIDEAMQG